ncbi:MAG: hypothetical protein KKB31_00515 [Nanoarchaeota archaeon]|nr:hypothetical protein [Nanoarchaeota archaeon]
MTYKKFLIVASKNNPAAKNITTNLSQFKKNPLVSGMANEPSFDFYLTEDEVLYNGNLDMNKINQYDFVIFPCTHRSEKGTKSLSVHVPGNWRTADLGGEMGKVCPTSALFQKHMFEILNEVAKQYEITDYEITLEVTHHGPLINKPCVFIEIGSSEEQWRDRKAGFVIAKTIADSINTFEPSPYREIAIGIGGPHYCPNFNKIQEVSNVALSHIIPTYASPITEEMIKEAITKTEEDVDFAVIDWKAFNSEERQRIIGILEKNYIAWKKTSDIDK